MVADFSTVLINMLHTRTNKLNLPEPPFAEMRTRPSENTMDVHLIGTNDLQDPRLK